jgi:hypothetical protein
MQHHSLIQHGTGTADECPILFPRDSRCPVGATVILPALELCLVKVVGEAALGSQVAEAIAPR